MKLTIEIFDTADKAEQEALLGLAQHLYWQSAIPAELLKPGEQQKMVERVVRETQQVGEVIITKEKNVKLVPEPLEEDPEPEPEVVVRKPAVDIAVIEKSVKPVRKPKGQPRPPRAKVHEKPGECIACLLAKATDAGWYCEGSMVALSADAKLCQTPQIDETRERLADLSAKSHEATEEPEPEPPAKPKQEKGNGDVGGRKRGGGGRFVKKDKAAAEAPPPKQESYDNEPPPKPAAPKGESYDDDGEDGERDYKALRQAVRAEARRCLTGSKEARAGMPTVIGSFSEDGQIPGIPDDLLIDCLAALKDLR